MVYKSGRKTSVDTDGTVVNSSDFGFEAFTYFSIFVDGDATIEIWLNGAYGSTIRLNANTGFDREISGTRLRIKAVTGTINANWYVESKLD